MAVLSKEFADDPCSKPKRQQMIIAARALLTSVTQLLILADLVDVQLILKSIRLVCFDLIETRKTPDHMRELMYIKFPVIKS